MKEPEKSKEELIAALNALQQKYDYLEATIQKTNVLQEKSQVEEVDYKELVGSMTEAFFVLDKKLRYTYWNKAAEKLSGFTAAEVIGKKMVDFFPNIPTIQNPEKVFKGVLETQKPLIFVNEQYRNGTVFFLEMTIYPINNGVAAITKDVTGHWQTEKILQDYRFAMDQHSIIAITDKQGTITFVNDKFCEISKYSKTELIGQNHRIINSGHHSKAFFKDLYKTIHSGEVWKGDIKNKAKDGSFYWVATTIIPLQHRRGDITEFISIRTDITAKKQVEAQLIEEQSFSKFIADNVPAMLAYWSSNEICKFANLQYIDWFGRTPQQMLGITIYELLGEELYKQNEPHIKAATAGKLQQFERILTKSNGEITHAFAQYKPYFVENKIDGFFALITDVTALKKTELELLKTREAYLRNHQLLEETQSIAKLGGWELDLVSNNLYWTDETYRLHDTSPEEFNPTVDAGLGYFLPESRRIISEALELAITKGIGYDLYLETYTSKGRKIDVRTTCVATMVDGKPIKLTGIFQDITAQKFTEEQLRLSRIKNENLINGIKGIVWEADAETFKFSFVSQQAETILGYPTSDWLDIPTFWADHIHPEDREWALEYCISQTRQNLDHQFEYRMIAKDGTTIWLLDQVYLQIENGKAKTLTGVMVDITQKKILEETLHKNEENYMYLSERFALACRSANIGVWEYNIEEQHTIWDDQVYALYGITRDTFSSTYEAWSHGIHPDDRQNSIHQLTTAIEEKKRFDMEFRVVWPDKSIHYLRTFGKLMHKSGKPVKMIGVNYDITARKKIEQELILAKEKAEESEHKIRTIFENSKMGISLTAEDGKLETNKAFYEMLGYTKEEFENVKWQDITHVDDLERDIEIVGSIRAGEKSSVSWEKRYIHKNGSIVWIDISTAGINFKNGKPQNYITTINDITEKKKQEIKLKESEEKYILLYESNLMPLAVFDAETLQFLSVNNAFVEKYGYTKEEFLTMTVLDIRPASEIEKVKQSLKETHEGVKNLGVYTHMKKNGEIIYVEIIRHDVIFDGKKARFVVINDVTDKKRKEEEILELNNSLENKIAIRTKELALANDGLILQNEENKKQASELMVAKNQAEESDRLKSAFLANMSHEIRTPMNAIMGFSDLLSHAQLDKKESEYVNSIKQAGNSLLCIINDILDISKIEAGMMTFENQIFSIREVLESTNKIFVERAKEKNLELEFACEAQVPDYFWGDSHRLSQILINLVGNAIKFTKNGRVKVFVKIAEQSSLVNLDSKNSNGKVFLNISVTDTGIGIRKEKLKYIFERFRQVGTQGNEKYRGTGLGLSIVKQLTELQGGIVVVESEFNVGSVFSCTIPYLVSEKVTVVKKNDGKYNMAKLSELDILLVEDNDLNILLLSTLFEEKKLKLQVVKNGSECIEKIKNTKFDIILMDLEMPIMNGYEATRIIRNEMKSNIPIISITAHAMAGEKEKCLSIGMSDYISKPINAELLFEKIYELTFKK